MRLVHTDGCEELGSDRHAAMSQTKGFCDLVEFLLGKKLYERGHPCGDYAR